MDGIAEKNRVIELLKADNAKLKDTLIRAVVCVDAAVAVVNYYESIPACCDSATLEALIQRLANTLKVNREETP